MPVNIGHTTSETMNTGKSLVAKQTVEKYQKKQAEPDENLNTQLQSTKPLYTRSDLTKLHKSQLASILKEKLGHSPSKKMRIDSMIQSILDGPSL